MRSVALSPATRERALDALAATTEPGGELDILVVGGGVVGSGAALDAATRGLTVGLVEARDFASGTSSRSSKLIHGGLRYLEMLDFALVRRGAEGARAAPPEARPAPGQAGAVPLPAAAQRLGAALRRLGRRALRHPRPAVGPGPGRPPPPPPHPPRRPAHRPRAEEGRAGRRAAVLRRADGRRAPHDVHRPHGRGLRRARGEPGAGRRVPARRASGSSAPGCRTWRRAASTRSGPGRSSTPPACGPTTPRRWSGSAGSSTSGRPRGSTSSCPGTGSTRTRG